MKKKLYVLVTIFIIVYLSLYFVACNAPYSNTMLEAYENKGYDKNYSDLQLKKASSSLETIAPVFSNVIFANPSLLNTIVENAMKKSDGDYDVLFELAKNFPTMGSSKSRSVSSNETFYMALCNAYEQHEPQSRSVYSATLDDLIGNIPDLNIFVYQPDYEKSYSAEDFYLTYLNYDIPEEEQKILIAYDKDGNKHKISGIEPPDFPVLVLGINERVARNATVESDYDAFIQARALDFNLINPKVCHKEILKSIEWKAKYGAYDPWPRGYPEVYCLYIYYPNGSRASYPEVDKKGKIYYYNEPIFYFYNYISNRSWQIMMYDEDIGSPIQKIFSLPGDKGASISVALSVGKNDDFIGSATVPFYHNKDNLRVMISSAAIITLAYEEEENL